MVIFPRLPVLPALLCLIPPCWPHPLILHGFPGLGYPHRAAAFLKLPVRFHRGIPLARLPYPVYLRPGNPDCLLVIAVYGLLDPVCHGAIAVAVHQANADVLLDVIDNRFPMLLQAVA